MKIFQIINGLGAGGAQKLTIELCNELSKEHNLYLFSFKPISDKMHFVKGINSNIKVLSFDKKPGINLSLIVKLFFLIKKIRPEVVHIQAPSIIKYILPSILLFRKIRFVYTLHSDIYEGNKRFLKQLDKCCLLRKRIICVCISAVLKENFSRNFSNVKFFVVENGLNKIKVSNKFDEVKKNIQPYMKDSETKVSISIGNLNKRVKNYSLLIDAFRLLKNVNAIALVIGDLETNNIELKNYIENEFDKNVFFIGFRSNVADYLAVSDFLTISSIREGLPLVALEALSLGMPVVSTPAGGMVDVLKSETNGFLSKDFSTNAFVYQIKKCLSMSHNEIEQMKHNNMQYFKDNYSINTCAKKYLELYKR